LQGGIAEVLALATQFFHGAVTVANFFEQGTVADPLTGLAATLTQRFGFCVGEGFGFPAHGMGTGEKVVVGLLVLIHIEGGDVTGVVANDDGFSGISS